MKRIDGLKKRISELEGAQERYPAWACAALGLFALFLTCALYLPLARDGTLQGRDDISYHLNRILSIADGLRGGQFPVLIYPDALNGYGYGSPLFYPDLFLYVPALLTLLGMPLGAAYAIFITLLVFACGFFYFLFARKIFHGLFASLFPACLFMAGHYTYAIVFYMCGIGQALAACFAPLLLLGIYNMVKEDFSRPGILLCAMLGILFSHTISLAIYGLFLVVVVLVYARKLFSDKRWWKKVGVIFALCLGIAACWFVPLIEQFADAKFLQSVPWAHLSEYAFPLEHLFFYSPQIWRRSSVVRYSVGLLPFLCLLLRLFIKRNGENRKALLAADWMLFGIFLSELVCSDLFPWRLLDGTVINVIQFPFRLLMIPALLLPLVCGLLVRELFRAPRLRVPRVWYAVLACLLVALSALYDVVYLPDWNRVDTDAARLHEYVGTGEWLPLYAGIEDIGTYRELEREQELRNGRGDAVPYARRPHSVKITFEAEAGETYTLPLIYYKGYCAKDAAGNRLLLFASPEGKVTVESSVSGTVVVTYAGTPLQGISYAVTGLTVCGIALWAWRRRRR